jgi:hypothetical protein
LLRLDHAHRHTVLPQPIRRGEPGDSSTDYQNRLYIVTRFGERTTGAAARKAAVQRHGRGSRRCDGEEATAGDIVPLVSHAARAVGDLVERLTTRGGKPREAQRALDQAEKWGSGHGAYSDAARFRAPERTPAA